MTSGGDCQSLNATMRGVAKTLYQADPEVEIYGILEGYKGLIYGNRRKLEPKDFSGILTEGGTIIGTSRQPFKKMGEPDENGLDKVKAMLDNYKKWKLDCLVILGGNGTHKTANLLSEKGCNVVTLPKTIDNDIWGTDITFGFQSAVDIASNVIDYIHSTASSHSRVFVVELMGRDAGWLAASTCLTGDVDLLIPEIPYDIEKVASAIEYRRKHGRNFSIIAVAEGAVSSTDAVLSEEERRRIKESSKHSTISYRIAAELESMTGQETRVTVPGHYQRGGPPCPYDRVLATQFGTAAARLIMEKKYGTMVGIQEGRIVDVPLEDAASRTKFLPVDHPLIQTARDAGTGFGD